MSVQINKKKLHCKTNKIRKKSQINRVLNSNLSSCVHHFIYIISNRKILIEFVQCVFWNSSFEWEKFSDLPIHHGGCIFTRRPLIYIWDEALRGESRQQFHYRIPSSFSVCFFFVIFSPKEKGNERVMFLLRFQRISSSRSHRNDAEKIHKSIDHLKKYYTQLLERESYSILLYNIIYNIL